MDYKTKYALQQQVIKDNFAHFDVPYNGADNNDYVDGKGFSEKDGSLKGAMLKAASLKDNFQQGDSYEQYQYFYHPDHLGSSSFITNTEGEVVQHIEYVPYGEVFIEERNNVWNTPYLFNAKEFDEETGLYYYGARYYDSRLAIFYTTDRYAEKYPWQSAYSYVGGNPIKYIDVRGDSVAVLTAPKGAGGAGHLAILIQDEEGKWSLFSKNGTDEKYGIKGANRTENSINRPNDEGKLKYNTIDQFLNDSENNPIEDGQREYTEAFVIPCSKEQDRAAEIGAKAILNEDYNVLFSNCAQTVQNALDKAGLNDGNDIKYSPAGLPYKDRAYIPNRIYKNIKEQNKNGYVYTK